jgi:hypothetical protein
VQRRLRVDRVVAAALKRDAEVERVERNVLACGST